MARAWNNSGSSAYGSTNVTCQIIPNGVDPAQNTYTLQLEIITAASGTGFLRYKNLQYYITTTNSRCSIPTPNKTWTDVAGKELSQKIKIKGSGSTGASSEFTTKITVNVDYGAVVYDPQFGGERTRPGGHTIVLNISNVDKLDRTSPATVANATLGSAFTVTTKRYDSSFTHTVQVKGGSQTSFQTLVTKSTAANPSVTLPINTWMPWVNAKSVTGTARVITYSGNTQIGYVDRSFTISAPKSSPSIPSSITLGTAFNLATSRPSSIFSHTVALKAGTQTSLLALVTKSTADTPSITAAISTWAPKITTSTSVTGTIRVTQYYNNVEIAYFEKTNVKVNVPTSVVPSISAITLSDQAIWGSGQSYYQKFGVFLNARSKLKLTWSETQAYGSAINSRSVKLFGGSASVTNLGSTGCNITITNKTGTGVANASITDKRSRTASRDTSSFKIISYSRPTLSYSMYRCDQNKTPMTEGSYIAFKYTLKTVSTDGTNPTSITVNDSNNQSVFSTSVPDDGAAGNKYTATDTVLLSGTYDSTLSYSFTISCVDTVGEDITNKSYSVPSASRPLSITAFGNTWGMAIGKFADTADLLDINIPVKMRKAVETGALSVMGNETITNGNLQVYTSDGGKLLAKNTNLSCKAGSTLPDSLTEFGALRRYDKDQNCVYYNVTNRTVDDKVYTSYVTRRLLSDNSEILHGFYFGINSDGSKYVSFYDSASRDAMATGLNVVKKAGDTMSGNLMIHKANAVQLTLRDSAISYGTAPSGTVYDRVEWQDSGGYAIGHVEIFQNSGKNLGVNIGVRNTNSSGSLTWYQATIAASSSGVITYTIPQAEKFRDAISAVYKAGDTMTGPLRIEQSSGDTGVYAKKTDTGVQVFMGVGTGGTNHGVYSTTLGKWMLYGDASNVYVNGVRIDNTLFKYKSYSYAYTVSANSYVNVTASNLGMSTPSGYTGLCAYKVWTGNSNCGITLYDVNNSGSSTACQVRNFSGSDRSGTMQIGIVYIRTGVISSL